jgi:hypothetical protein
MRARLVGRLTVAASLALLMFGCAAPGSRATNAQASVSPVAAPEPSGPDAPPNHADNNGWKQRHELSAADKRVGQELAAKIRPKLEALRAAGDFAPASTRQSLLDLGIKADAILVTTVRPPVGEQIPPPGAVYAVHFASVGCVIGEVWPGGVTVEVTGSADEFGCLEPFSH